MEKTNLLNMMCTMSVGTDRWPYVVFKVLAENCVLVAPAYNIDESNVNELTEKKDGHVYYKGDYNCLPHINLDDILVLKKKKTGLWKSTEDGYAFFMDKCSPYRDPEF